jgi:hypothetical protein
MSLSPPDLMTYLGARALTLAASGDRPGYPLAGRGAPAGTLTAGDLALLHDHQELLLTLRTTGEESVSPYAPFPPTTVQRCNGSPSEGLFSSGEGAGGTVAQTVAQTVAPHQPRNGSDHPDGAALTAAAREQRPAQHTPRNGSCNGGCNGSSDRPTRGRHPRNGQPLHRCSCCGLSTCTTVFPTDQHTNAAAAWRQCG